MTKKTWRISIANSFECSKTPHGRENRLSAPKLQRVVLGNKNGMTKLKWIKIEVIIYLYQLLTMKKNIMIKNACQTRFTPKKMI